ncbi:hypothetical protein C8J57DRAFT_1518809 [Mycena rebaudengoi]|nr:hypothetical protein C8J57DRAFT_1518809 [Mycena rebaudengoi]
MKLLVIFVALSTVFSVSASPVAVPEEGAYSTSNLVGLPEKPETAVDKALATKLLDILENYGLTNNFGVVAIHSHMSLAEGQVIFQHGNASSVSQGIEIYEDVKDTGIPYTYRITDGALLPLDLGDSSPEALAARDELAAATAGNFLNEKHFKDFSAATGGHLAGIAYVRPLDRAALENNGVVKNHYNEALTAGSAAAVSLAAAQTDDAPSFFTRGIGNSTDPSRITILCSVCGHGNPWAD